MSCSQKNFREDLKVKIHKIPFVSRTNNNTTILYKHIRTGTNVHVYSLHPGIVDTELCRTLDKVYFPGVRALVMRIFCYPWVKTPDQGAQTTLHCSIDEKAGEETGLYYR